MSEDLLATRGSLVESGRPDREREDQSSEHELTRRPAVGGALGDIVAESLEHGLWGQLERLALEANDPVVPVLAGRRWSAFSRSPAHGARRRCHVRPLKWLDSAAPGDGPLVSHSGTRSVPDMAETRDSSDARWSRGRRSRRRLANGDDSRTVARCVLSATRRTVVVPLDWKTELEQLRRSLVRPLGRDALADEPELAFEQHALLAVRIQRAAQLSGRGHRSQRERWVDYLVDHFPAGRNGEDDAGLLWDTWRSALLRDEEPNSGVVLTHGHRDSHWERDEQGGLVVDLESMWEDFVASVEHFVHALKVDRRRRQVVVNRWRSRRWVLRTPGTVVAAAGAVRGSRAARKRMRGHHAQRAQRADSPTLGNLPKTQRYPRGLARLQDRRL